MLVVEPEWKVVTDTVAHWTEALLRRPAAGPLSFVMATAEDFFAIDMRVGTVVRAEPFPEARKPSIRLVIDFGSEIGEKRSSAQLTMHYTPETLVGRQVVAAVNLGTRRIAGFSSEVLVLGGMPTEREVVLLAMERPVANGTRIG
jgi:tRNA-binding protein